MGIEAKINYQLNKYPAIKIVVKNVYQRLMYALSNKIKFEGNINCVSPNDEGEYFFGYYDKSPWDVTDRYMLCLRAKDTSKEVAPKETADILLIDTENNNAARKIGSTSSWNVQQGCMLQWLGPDFSSKVLYNDFRNNKYCSVVLELATGKEKIIEFPVYSVSQDGSFALSLDFSRLHRLRKGYGYSNLDDITKNEKIPQSPCIWKIDLRTGETLPFLSYDDFYNFETKPTMIDAEHKVNHIMISPNGKRFMVLHRWFNGQRKYTRLVTCDCDGNNMYNLSDDDMVSHCYWKDDENIFAYERKNHCGNGYYLMQDKTNNFTRYWQNIENDGHPSFSPDGSLVVTDSYPDRERIAHVILTEKDDEKGENIKEISRVFAPFKYDNDTRCDLHPRWNHKGDKICIDSVFEGHRGLYVIEVV